MACALGSFVSTTAAYRSWGNLSPGRYGTRFDYVGGRVDFALLIAAYYTLPVMALVYGISGWIRATRKQDESARSLAVWAIFLGIIGLLYADGMSTPLGY